MATYQAKNAPERAFSKVEKTLELLEHEITEMNSQKPCRKTNYIGETIKEFRALRKITQIELSEIMNISQPLLSSFESGRQIPNCDQIYDLCFHLKINPVAFFSRATDKSFVLCSTIELSAEEHEKKVLEFEKEIRRTKLKKMEIILTPHSPQHLR